MAEKKVIVKRPPKTVKELKFAKEYINTNGNATKAALASYNTTPKTAARVGSEVLAKLDITSYFKKAGLTHEVLTQAVTIKALTAKKRDHFSGEYEDDHRVQLDSLKFAADLMGLMQKETTNIQLNLIPILGEHIAIPVNHSDQEGNTAQEED